MVVGLLQKQQLTQRLAMACRQVGNSLPGGTTTSRRHPNDSRLGPVSRLRLVFY